MLANCRNSEIKYEAQMYNWYPIFYALSQEADFRMNLNDRCYNTIRLLEQGYYWYPISPHDTDDALSTALNGSIGYSVESVENWYDTKD